jgi:hypothetical protein
MDLYMNLSAPRKIGQFKRRVVIFTYRLAHHPLFLLPGLFFP